jgi:hypothetical protein
MSGFLDKVEIVSGKRFKLTGKFHSNKYIIRGTPSKNSLMDDVPKTKFPVCGKFRIDSYDESDNSTKFELPDYFFYHLQRQCIYKLSSEYLHKYSERYKNIVMPTILSWAYDIRDEYDMSYNAFQLCVHIYHRFLMLREEIVDETRHQLTICACLLIAGKVEDIYPPRCGKFVYISDNCFTGKELVRMERNILNTIGFSTYLPTPIHFYDYCCTLVFEEMEDLFERYEKFIFLTTVFMLNLKYIDYTPLTVCLAVLYMIYFVECDLSSSSIHKIFVKKMEMLRNILQANSKPEIGFQFQNLALDSKPISSFEENHKPRFQSETLDSIFDLNIDNIFACVKDIQQFLNNETFMNIKDAVSTIIPAVIYLTKTHRRYYTIFSPINFCQAI